MFWEPAGGGAVRCGLCAHRCLVQEGMFGLCAVRCNVGGSLRSLVRNRLIAEHVDPIEKKPLYHFLPGSHSYSVASAGCNFKCDFCQNWQISQAPRGGSVPGALRMPEDVVADALRAGCESVSFTYTEPTIFFETAMDIGTIARSRGLKNVFVTNGYLTREAVGAAAAFLDGANVDLKCFSDSGYRKVCGAALRGVLDGITSLHRAGVWLELTTLVIPGFNDGEGEIRDIARWIASLSRDIPWHISRFHPDFKMNSAPPTPLATIRRAMEIGAEEGLNYIYLGNVAGGGQDTFCRGCEKMVISRAGFSSEPVNLAGGRCAGCGRPLPGVFGAG